MLENEQSQVRVATLSEQLATLEQERQTLEENILILRQRREAAILAQRAYSELLAGPDDSSNNAWLSQLSISQVTVHNRNVDYLLSLLDFANIQAAQRTLAKQDLGEKLQGDAAFSALSQAGDGNSIGAALDNTRLAELDNWIESEGGQALAGVQASVRALRTSNISYSDSLSSFEGATGRFNVASIQFADAQQNLRSLLSLQDEQNNEWAAPYQAAQGDDAQLAALRQAALSELQLQLSSLQNQEEILNELTPLLQQALVDAFVAGQKAVEQQALESVVDTAIQQFLRIQPCDIPGQSTRDVVFNSARLAAQLSIKQDVDGAVDSAEAQLADVQRRQQCRQSWLGRVNESNRALIIQLFEDYLNNINADVIAAQNDLATAEEEQRQANESEKSELPIYIADILADAIANAVADELQTYLCQNRYRFREMNCAVNQTFFLFSFFQPPQPNFSTLFADLQRLRSAATAAALNDRRDQVGIRLNSILARERYRARWQMRLHTQFVRGQLTDELAAGIDNPAERRPRAVCARRYSIWIRISPISSTKHVISSCC